MENETEYGLEMPADLEQPDQEPAEPEPVQPEEPEQEETEQDPEVPEQESEEPETDPGEGSLEEQPEDGEEEDPVEEAEDPETVSGNDLVVGGDVIVFPEGYELAALAGEPVDVDTESIVQAIEKQDDILTAGFACTSFMLGLLAGAFLIAGFRLRRV